MTTAATRTGSTPSYRENRRDSAAGGEVDILGIGFGPANLSFAIGLEEFGASGETPTVRFVEAKPVFGWHDGMLLPRTNMQISFLKDLVSMRNPTSSYSFLNYLHERGRLPDFINLKTFFPSRHEFHDYLSWAADRVGAEVTYSTRATRIDWDGDVFVVQTQASGGGAGETIRARNIVVGAGIQAVLPEGVEASTRVFHNQELLGNLDAVPSRRHNSFLVVGSGQSAAEVAAYLHETYPEAQVHAAFRRFGYTPSDDTPYANRIFDPEAVDTFYTASDEVKQRMLDNHWLTNYSAVDSDLIEELYQREYEESIPGERRLVVHRLTAVDNLAEGEDGVTVTLRDLSNESHSTIDVDAVVYATGFAPFDTHSLLGDTIDAAPAYFENGKPKVGRDYRLQLPGVSGGIFLNGGVEHSHGLTSSLLSNVAIRSLDILRATNTIHTI